MASSTHIPPMTMDKPKPALPHGFKELYQSGRYSDLTLVCGKKRFKVHKCVLDTQSTVFRKMLGGDFKEAEQNKIKLEDDMPDVLAALLHYLYHTALPTAAPGITKAQSNFMVWVYAIADKYDVPGLRDLATARFAEILVADENASNIDGFVAGIRAVQGHTADIRLWDIVDREIMSNLEWLADNDQFFELLKEMPELNKVLLKNSARNKVLSNNGQFNGLRVEVGGAYGSQPVISYY
ncbi:hypothetical protein LTR17_003871 [Elasticomyces elasticus]|nr:hypothetical protein LTR17_003871 [Elasticomyces elasticus]